MVCKNPSSYSIANIKNKIKMFRAISNFTFSFYYDWSSSNRRKLFDTIDSRTRFLDIYLSISRRKMENYSCSFVNVEIFFWIILAIFRSNRKCILHILLCLQSCNLCAQKLIIILCLIIAPFFMLCKRINFFSPVSLLNDFAASANWHSFVYCQERY